MRDAQNPWILALALVGCRAPEPCATHTEAAHGTGVELHSAVAVGALAEAQVALAAWRRELERGDRLDDGALLDLRSAAQELGRELGALWGTVEARDAALRPDPQAQARAQGLGMLARGLADPWVRDIRADGDGAQQRRTAALDAVRSALASDAEVQQLAGLTTLQQLGDVEVDRASFRPLVLPFAREATGLVLVAALVALDSTDRRPEDLELVHAAWERDPEGLGDQTLRFLKTYGEGRIEGRSEQIALACLAEVHPRRANQQLNGLWGAEVGAALEARVLELARSSDRELRHAAIYFGLATFADKSEAVVDALIEALAEPDPGNRDRALWGLGQGVPEALQPGVAAALVDLHNSRSDPELRDACARLVARYGDADDEARLER